MLSSLRRVRAIITVCAGLALCALVLAGPATARSAYPPAPPTQPTVCASHPGSGPQLAGNDAGGACVDAVSAHHVDHPNSVSGHGANSHSGLAQTGFDVTVASVIVVVLLGVGGLCIAAGRRRRHA